MIGTGKPPRGPILFSLGALVLMNLLPVFGVLVFGWRVFDVMILFWLENIVIGLFNVVRMGTRLVLMRDFAALMLIPFFTFHYGAFCAGHGLFVLALFGGEGSGPIRAGDVSFGPFGVLSIVQKLLSAQEGFLFALIGLVASHFVSFVVNFLGRGEYRRINAGDLMHGPYKRIVVLHVAIILGAFAVTAFGQPVFALLVLIALKTAIDAFSHLKERERLAETPAPAGPVAP